MTECQDDTDTFDSFCISTYLLLILQYKDVPFCSTIHLVYITFYVTLQSI